MIEGEKECKFCDHPEECPGIGEPCMEAMCPVCGCKPWDGYGHPFGGKRTPPKTRWCTSQPTDTEIDLIDQEIMDEPRTVVDYER